MFKGHEGQDWPRRHNIGVPQASGCRGRQHHMSNFIWAALCRWIVALKVQRCPHYSSFRVSDGLCVAALIVNHKFSFSRVKSIFLKMLLEATCIIFVYLIFFSFLSSLSSQRGMKRLVNFSNRWANQIMKCYNSSSCLLLPQWFYWESHHFIW